jgi:hypothetical protein
MTAVHEPQSVDKLASLDAQALVGMVSRWYMRQAARDGFRLTAIEARDAAIAAVFGCQPVGNRKP